MRTTSRDTRALALGDEDEQQRADTVHEQHDRRVHLEDERHEHGRAEHRKHMLDGQRHEQARRHLFLYLNDSVALHRFFIPPKIFLFYQTRQRNRFLICSIRAHVILYPIS